MWGNRFPGLFALALIVTADVVTGGNLTAPPFADEVISESRQTEEARPEGERKTKSCREQCASEGFSPEECDMECNWVASSDSLFGC